MKSKTSASNKGLITSARRRLNCQLYVGGTTIWLLCDLQPLIIFRYDGREGLVEPNSPCLAVCFDIGLMQIMRREVNESMFVLLYLCLLITLTRCPKTELRRAQLNGIGRMHMKGASDSHQRVMNDPGAQQPSQMFLTWVKVRPQNRELRALLLTNSVWVLQRPTVIYNKSYILIVIGRGGFTRNRINFNFAPELLHGTAPPSTPVTMHWMRS